MLQITIPATENWDEAKQEFVLTKEYTLQLEHSLVSISKWESKWCKPFLSSKDKTMEETADYIKCMTLTKNVPDEVYNCINSDNIQKILDYINAPMTATTFPNNQRKGSSREIVTSELIYYWMTSFNIPSEYEKWHLNRLITLIQVCGIKNTPSKKMRPREILNQNAAINAARLARTNGKG